MAESLATTTNVSMQPTTVSSNVVESLIETRQHCLKALTGIITLVTDIGDVLNQSDHVETPNNTHTILNHLKFIYSNVENLELRMCIVAPMKAGKSTIINAILGQNILPTRNTAMTVIPTEIELQVVKPNGNDEEPSLLMEKELIEQIKAMQQEIRVNLANSRTLEDLKGKLPEHTHLVPIAEEIRDAVGVNRILEERTVGTQHICTILQYINDVIRLHELLIPTEITASSRQLFKNLPRITAPYISLDDGNDMHETLGNLIVVDTPGPNENTTTNFLKEIIIRELKRTTVILVVLDYTALNTEADNIIKTEIMNIRHASNRDNDSFFALVNKVDRRRKGDMTPAQVYDHVYNTFHIGQNVVGHSTSGYVFEVQALRALLAKQFLTDLNDMNQNQSFQIKDLKSGSDFLAEAYGAAYDEEDPPTIDKAKRDAAKLWRRSGFETFLHGSIEKLIEKAAPRAIESALNHCQSYLHRLHENLTIREKLLCADEQALRHQSDALLADMQKVHDVMEKQRTALGDEQTRITTQFQMQFTQMKKETLGQLTRMLNDHGLFNVVDMNSAAMTIMGATTPPIFLRSSFHNMIWRIAKALGDQAVSGGILKFEKEFQGRNFIRDIERQICAISEAASVEVGVHVDKECDLACARLNQHLQENTKEILKTAQNRLANTFDIKFEKPPIFDPVYSASTDFELKLQKTYRPWWLLGLISISYDEGYVEGTTYQIRIDNMKRHCMKLLETHMSAIERELNKYLTDVLKQNFDQHFDKLRELLSLYLDYVNKSLDDQARTRDEKATLKVLLVEFIKQINDQIKVVTDIQKNFESRAYSTSVDAE
jgi:hypothetical protein